MLKSRETDGSRSKYVDLYLFEQGLRNDTLLNETERLRRWNRRLRWEEISHAQRQEEWVRMTAHERGMLGVETGGWWAYRLRQLPLNTSYGHEKELIGTFGLFQHHYDGFRKGTFDAHFPLSTSLKARFPFWRDGGFGLGRSLIKWLELPTPTEIPAMESKKEEKNRAQSSFLSSNPAADLQAEDQRAEARREAELRQERDYQLLVRKMAAEDRRAHLIASVQAQSSVRLPHHSLAYVPPPPRMGPIDALGYAVPSPTQRLHRPAWGYPDRYGAVYAGAPVRPRASSAHATTSRREPGLPWGSLLPEIRQRRAESKIGEGKKKIDEVHSSSPQKNGDQTIAPTPPPPAYQARSGVSTSLPQPPRLFTAKGSNWGKPPTKEAGMNHRRTDEVLIEKLSRAN